MAYADRTAKAQVFSKWSGKSNSTRHLDEAKRQEMEAWHNLNRFIMQEGGMVTSAPGKMLRVEIVKGSSLPTKLKELGFNVWRAGSTTRVTSDGFRPFDVIEISVDGR